MPYHFQDIEAKWQHYWEKHRTFEVQEDPSRPACYVLDMFPYPSGAGLHVGHPLGYVASDVYAHYKRLQGYNVLHPIGFDAFGLPAEQFALKTGKHPEQSTQENITTYIRQLKSIGLSYAWSRQVITSSPSYYKWTQWIFLQFFQSWFDPVQKKARPINTLTDIFEKEGNRHYPFPGMDIPNEQINHSDHFPPSVFNAAQWQHFTATEKDAILMRYRLAYLNDSYVNWCPQLGTVLANDEIINGVSYRGGHPVVKKKMRQWHLRITAYADRLLEGLEKIDFSPSMKEIQRNWIGRSEGAWITFPIEGKHSHRKLGIFTTRPDTIFGVDFIALAAEHPLITHLIEENENKAAIEAFIEQSKARSEVEKMANVKNTSGIFLNAYALHPITKKKLPIWIADYVLMHYGTGAIMGVADGDERDQRFAEQFQIPITSIFQTDGKILKNSGFLNGLDKEKAIPKMLTYLKENHIGDAGVQYKMRDAGWSRQRYWGEPFPIYYDTHGMPQPLPELPLELPATNNFEPTSDGQGPLGQIPEWIRQQKDTNTMPTHAGAAWHFLRYTDPHNQHAFSDKEKINYWGAVDVYVGGSEHAVSHLLYARLFTKLLYDLGYLPFEEPFKKLINQGKITGNSYFAYRIRGTNDFVSLSKKDAFETDELHVDISLVNAQNELDRDGFKQWMPSFANAQFILEDGKYICGTRVEKMSKSKFNVINPDEVIARYGADTLRLYELFLGPLEQSKPWDIKGIEGVHRFLKKVWRLFAQGEPLCEDAPSAEEWRHLHTCIHKVTQDTEAFAFNTAISALMVCVNELSALSCNKRTILMPLLILLSPYAPHLCCELWEQYIDATHSLLSGKTKIWPLYEARYTQQTHKSYPISFNGKTRTQILLPIDITQEEVEQSISTHPDLQKWIQGKPIKKIIFVPGRIINIII